MNGYRKPEWKRKREEQIRERVWAVIAVLIELAALGFAVTICLKANVKAHAEEVPSLYAGVAQALQEVSVEPVTETVEVVPETETIVEQEIETEMQETVQPDPNEVYELAKIIECECGADNVSDLCSYYTGSVILNRVKSPYFANTIHNVIFEQGQYQPTFEGGSWYYTEPDERSLEIAEELLIGGSVLPDNVVFQAGFKQGSGVYAETDGVLFCYIDY